MIILIQKSIWICNLKFFHFPLAPECETTHWKQSVFNIDKITVRVDDFIYGTFKMSPNEENQVMSGFLI